MEELGKRDELYNALLETLKKHSSGLEVGAVRAVLQEVDGEICCRMNNINFDIVCEQFKRRKPRE